jgi:hypothetical protein
VEITANHGILEVAADPGLSMALRGVQGPARKVRGQGTVRVDLGEPVNSILSWRRNLGRCCHARRLNIAVIRRKADGKCQMPDYVGCIVTELANRAVPDLVQRKSRSYGLHRDRLFR